MLVQVVNVCVCVHMRAHPEAIIPAAVGDFLAWNLPIVVLPIVPVQMVPIQVRLP